MKDKNIEKIESEIQSHREEAREQLAIVIDLLNQIDDIDYGSNGIMIGISVIENDNELMEKQRELEGIVRTYTHCLNIIDTYKNWY